MRVWNPEVDPYELPEEVYYGIDWSDDDKSFEPSYKVHPHGIQMCAIRVDKKDEQEQIIKARKILHDCDYYQEEDEPGPTFDACRHCCALGRYSVCERQLKENTFELFVRGTIKMIDKELVRK